MRRDTRMRGAWWMAVPLSLWAAACSDDDATLDQQSAPISANLSPTWHRDVAPIVITKCSGCHKEGGIGPFSLETYDKAEPFAGLLVDAVESGRMPPFLAQETDDCTPDLPWANDLRLSAEEKATLRAWADQDAPEGEADPLSSVEVPKAVTLEREDVVMTLPKPVEVSGTQDLHLCQVLDPGLSEDVYVTGRLVTSGNEKVLHHVVSYVIPPGTNDDGTPRTKAQLEAVLMAEKGVSVGEHYDCFGGPGLDSLQPEMLDAWAPGGLPNMAPADSGQPLDKNSLVIMDMHYHPTGSSKETDEETKLALMVTDKAPAWVSRIVLLGNFEETLQADVGVGKLLKRSDEDEARFLIPAGAADHVEEMTWTWDFPESPFGETQLYVYAMATHMHYVGRDMQVFLEHGSNSPMAGDNQCLIQTPAWDFNWQRSYEYDAPREDLPIMVSGDVVRMRCTFDNSKGNRFVREALSANGLSEPVDVPLGEDTLDEMCLAGIGIMYPNVPMN